MGIYSKAKEAPVMGRARKLWDYLGEYKLEVVEVTDGEGKQSGQPFYSAKLKVLEATGDGAAPVDTEVTWTIVRQPGKQSDYFLSDIKKFIGAVTGLAPEDIGEKEIEDSVGDKQELTGAPVRASVFNRKLKDGAERATVVFSEE
jgi:hypothetical protein